jgi:hypothetical protein
MHNNCLIHPLLNYTINDIKFNIINLRDDLEIKESYFSLYDYLVEYLKEVNQLNTKFKKWYKNKSSEYSKMLDKIYQLVNLYYNYDSRLLNREEVIDILNNIKLKFDQSQNIKEVISEYVEYFNEKINQVISEQSLKYADNKELIIKKQKSMYDIFYDVIIIISKKSTITDYELYINKMQEDILLNIDIFTVKDDSNLIDVFKYDKKRILEEIESTKRKILKYVYSKSILHFDNYLHHLRNIYLGIRFYLQKGYMNKRFVKDDVEVYNKYYCYITDISNQLVLGMIVNKFKDNKNKEYLQEHIFISNNIKVQIFGESKRKQLSLLLHSYASNLQPQSNKIYCNPMPSMLKIFREADKEGKIKLNILLDEEKEEIKAKQIACFKFPPTISIVITNEFKNYFMN